MAFHKITHPYMCRQLQTGDLAKRQQLAPAPSADTSCLCSLRYWHPLASAAVLASAGICPV
eukprot:1633931-Heterocapsa_arctica.AAC.1